MGVSQEEGEYARNPGAERVKMFLMQPRQGLPTSQGEEKDHASNTPRSLTHPLQRQQVWQEKLLTFPGPFPSAQLNTESKGCMKQDSLKV